MDVRLVLMFSLLLIRWTDAFLTDRERFRRSNSQIDLLRNKLTNLQTLLKDIEISQEKSPEETDVVKKAEESQMNAPKTARENNSREKLTKNEVAILKTLKETLSRHKDKTQEAQLDKELENKGTFYDESFEGKSDDVTILKALAEKLSKDSNQMKITAPDDQPSESTKSKTAKSVSDDTEVKDVDLSTNKNEVQPKEGKFTLFRQEVLAQVEDRLLQDMEFAIKMGFTIQEILTDLQLKEKRFEELKIEEMKQEIARLKQLRGKE